MPPRSNSASTHGKASEGKGEHKVTLLERLTAKRTAAKSQHEEQKLHEEKAQNQIVERTQKQKAQGELKLWQIVASDFNRRQEERNAQAEAQEEELAAKQEGLRSIRRREWRKGSLERWGKDLEAQFEMTEE